MAGTVFRVVVERDAGGVSAGRADGAPGGDTGGKSEGGSADAIGESATAASGESGVGTTAETGGDKSVRFDKEHRCFRELQRIQAAFPRARLQ